MSAALTIAAAHTRARFVGNAADKAVVKARLEAVLVGPVAARVAGLEVGSEEVICVPRIAVKLRLTRAELDSADAADRWAAAIEAAVGRPAQGGPGVWRFANRRAFHAGYIRFRLGVLAAPRPVFTGFGALDLLSPLRAMAEMVAADPGLWAALADGVDGVDAALALVRAVVAQGGEAGIAMVLAGAAGQESAAVKEEQMHGALRQLRGLLSVLGVVPAGLWTSLPAQAQRLLAALLIGAEGPVDPLPLAGVFVTLLALVGHSGVVGEGAVSVALARLQVDNGVAWPEAGVLAKLAKRDRDIAADLAAVLPVVAKHFAAQAQLAEGVLGERRAEVAGSKTSKSKAAAAAPRHFSAPFAGVALVLPHLAEDRIGAAFPAAVRFQALARLVRCDLFPTPEQSDFLGALVGVDDKDLLPDRPNPRDLLFIPKARHAAVMEAPPGAPRLAQWLCARFAATLPGLGLSSLPFLQRQFFHIPGEVWIDKDQITLRLDPMPLLAVLELAGRCGADVARLDWLDRQRLTIRCERGL